MKCSSAGNGGSQPSVTLEQPGSRRLLQGNRRLLGGNRRLLEGSRRLLGGNRRLLGGNRRLLGGSRRRLEGNRRLWAFYSVSQRGLSFSSIAWPPDQRLRLAVGQPCNAAIPVSIRCRYSLEEHLEGKWTKFNNIFGDVERQPWGEEETRFFDVSAAFSHFGYNCNFVPASTRCRVHNPLCLPTHRYGHDWTCRCATEMCAREFQRSCRE